MATWTMHDRVVAILQGRRPDCIPFIDRIEFWYKHHRRQGTLPDEFKGMSESEVHRAVGIGQEAWQLPYAYKYNGVEVLSKFEGEVVYHDIDPTLDFFPAMWDLITQDKVGITTTEFITPVGKLTVQHEMLANMITAGTRPYLKDRVVKEQEDYRTFEYIIERAEYIPRYENFFIKKAELGDHGYLVPNIERIPFQSLLIDVIGEMQLFYDLHDNPQSVERLINVLDAQTTDKLQRMADFSVPYVEFVDNLDGFMTNPKLFKKYCLPYYQRYSEMLNGQGKKMGSHTDGDLQHLVGLIAECGLDVCESFTPAPITGCTFEEAWETWREGPIIWGGIPSYYLEERISEGKFQEHIERLLDTIGDHPIILGVGDAVMSDNLIERVRYVARRVEEYTIG